MSRRWIPFYLLCLGGLLFFTSCAGVDIRKTGIPEGSSDLFEQTRPVFVMPLDDLEAGNGIEAVFYNQKTTEGGSVIEITVVFQDEDHPSGFTDGLYDIYRSFRYRRVKDVETFFFHYCIDGVVFSRFEFPGTYAGDQVFGEKKVEHFSAEVPATEFDYIGSRAVIHVTTWNHLFRESAVEPGLETRAVGDYPVYPGTRAEVEALIAR